MRAKDRRVTRHGSAEPIVPPAMSKLKNALAPAFTTGSLPGTARQADVSMTIEANTENTRGLASGVWYSKGRHAQWSGSNGHGCFVY